MAVAELVLKESIDRKVSDTEYWQNICYFRNMETLIVQPKTKEQLAAIKAFMKALKIDFKVEEKSPYDPEFVKKILQGEEDIRNGKGVKIATEDLWK
ncbi:DUF2683 family protein [Pedobacter heparinus]|uniref:DUF2683 family protein n=1 Tax=Pedobacter heparinus TaxID=984 RepID=UPI00292D3673|nr:DUF2683 family protein [Pedobacter heparinus]